jgi:C-terminal processing protease CtpA/Prc
MNTATNDFAFVVETIEKNYAGFPSKVTEITLNAYSVLKASLRDSFLTNEDPKKREEAIRAFIAFFKDKHISIQANGETQEETNGIEQRPTLEKLDGDTVLICIPSFMPEHYESIEKLIQDHHELLTTKTNLVLDLRGNGGGSDSCFNPLLPYVCSESIEVVGADVRATQGNIEYLQDLAKLHEFPEESLNQIKALSALMAQHLGGFVEMVPTQKIDLGETFDKPERVAICIDKNCASSTEQFLIFALQSPKVTLFGENTAGCIDFSNVVPAQTPSGNFTIFYPISRSKRIPLHQIDGHGIDPHVPMDPGSKDLISEVVRHLHADIQ